MGVDLHAETVNRVIAALREERMRHGISQETLAKMAGISRTGLRHVESGNYRPTLYTLLKIAEAVNVDLAKTIARAVKGSKQG